MATPSTATKRLKFKTRSNSYTNFVGMVKGMFKRKRKGADEERKATVFNDSRASDMNEDPDIQVLLLGTPGAGKSTVIKQLRISSGSDNVLFDELESEKVFLQYDLVTGVMKVIERMMALEDNGHKYIRVNRRDRTLYQALEEKFKKIRAHGDFVRDEEDNDNYYDTQARIETKNSYELPLSSKEWKRLSVLSRREDFLETLKQRFMPTEDEYGKPLRVTDGFSELIQVEDIWSQARDKNPSSSSYLFIRKPNGGLPVTHVVCSSDRNIEEKLAITEYPGRIESLVDVLALLKEQNTATAFRCIVLAVSYADFDVTIETEESEEKVYDVLLKLLAELNDDFKSMPIYLLFTKGDVLRQKLEFYQEQSLLESRLAFPLDPRAEGNIDEIWKATMTDIRERFIGALMKVWSEQEHVKQFPRQLKLQYDSVDALQIFGDVLKLAKTGTLQD